MAIKSKLLFLLLLLMFLLLLFVFSMILDQIYYEEDIEN